MRYEQIDIEQAIAGVKAIADAPAPAPVLDPRPVVSPEQTPDLEAHRQYAWYLYANGVSTDQIAIHPNSTIDLAVVTAMVNHLRHGYPI